MRFPDLFQLSTSSVTAYPLRSFLTGLGIAIGISSVILLTSIGEGLHQFILSEFSQFGTHLITIQPGKSQIQGGSVGIFGSTRPLSIEDAQALQHLIHIDHINPSMQGNAEVRFAGKTRRTTIYGAGHDFPNVLACHIESGTFLPDDNPIQARAMVVLGSKVKQELFPSKNPLGNYLHISGQRYLIVGVMAPKGQMLGLDLDDAVFIPVARAMELFNRPGLMSIQVTYTANTDVAEVTRAITTRLIERHGREDFTLIPQEKALEVLGSVLNVITFAVGALGGISLLVGGIGILTITTMAVTERTAEIGLLRALGAHKRQILLLFLSEAVLLSSLGGLAGLILGVGITQTLHAAFPVLPVDTPWSFTILAELSAISIGLLAGVIPANKAANLDAVIALHSE